MKKIMISVVEAFYFFLKPFSEMFFILEFGFKCFMTYWVDIKKTNFLYNFGEKRF